MKCKQIPLQKRDKGRYVERNKSKFGQKMRLEGNLFVKKLLQKDCKKGRKSYLNVKENSKQKEIGNCAKLYIVQKKMR